LIDELKKVQSITPDLHKVLIVAGIDHELTIITILVRNRGEILHITSLGTLDEHAVIIADHVLRVNLDQIAVVAGAHITLPFKGGRTIDGERGAVGGLHCPSSMIEKIKKVQKKVILICTFSNDCSGFF
jgi:hypothetical protein